jgi:nitroimidazol reductase NimA-like FMN-containing flavoprotein (pyridoxamine 5'-phosphate oxidase superfamily)
MEPTFEQLTEDESLRLAGQQQVGRIGFTGRYGPVVLPVNFKVVDRSIVFRTDEGSPLEEDLRTGITAAEYRVAFEIDDIQSAERTGWSVLIQGAAHFLEDEDERAAALDGVTIDPWVGGDKDVYIQIKPARISGRRVRRD